MTLHEADQGAPRPVSAGSDPLAVLRLPPGTPRDVLLGQVGALSAALGVPVQALHGDRVLSGAHLVMAQTHAARAIGQGRARASDPAVEFLLYAAADRQIHRAVAALGVPREAVEVLVVVLGPVAPDAAQQAARRVGMTDAAAWPVPAVDQGVHGPAADWWRARLGGRGDVEEGLLAQMALLALDRP